VLELLGAAQLKSEVLHLNPSDSNSPFFDTELKELHQAIKWADDELLTLPEASFSRRFLKWPSISDVRAK
jgi:hypothetical protein